MDDSAPSYSPVRAAQLVAACDLPSCGRRSDSLTVLELGWSQALLFLSTWQTWQREADRGHRLRYLALLPQRVADSAHIEAAPHHTRGVHTPWRADHALPTQEAALQAGIEPERLAALRAGWPWPIAGVHRLELDHGRVQLTLAMGDPAQLLPGLVTQVDLLLAAQGQYGLTPPLLRRAGLLLSPIGLAVTDRVDRDVLDGLRTAGLRPQEQHSTPPDVMLLRPTPRRAATAVQTAPAEQARRAVVIGAGLAGSATAFALGRRGWSVDVLEDAPFQHSGSAQPALAQHPSVTRDDALLSRLTRAAFALSLGAYTSDTMRRIGRLQCCPQSDAEALAAGWPSELVQVASAAQAAALSGLRGAGPGLWWPQVGCVDPLALRASWQVAGVSRQSGVSVHSLRRVDDQWLALDARGMTVAQAPVMIMAAGVGTLKLCVLDADADADHAHTPAGAERTVAARSLSDALGSVGWQVRRARSSIARVARHCMPACIIGGDGHAIPLDAHHVLLGPAWDIPAVADSVREHDARSAWSRHAAQVQDDTPPLALQSCAFGERLSSRDHLPLIGAVPDLGAVQAQQIELRRNDRLPIPSLPGLWMASGFGGRGLLWAVLAAELLAARLESEPLPLAQDLVGAIDPARFLRRSLREGHTRAI